MNKRKRVVDSTEPPGTPLLYRLMCRRVTIHYHRDGAARREARDKSTG